ncbi:sugar transferase [Candidatus Latescibacterota bacterium]
MKLFLSRILILIVDQTMLVLSFVVTYWLSFVSVLSPNKAYMPISDYILPCVILNIYWIIIFAVFGLYGKWKHTSRFDEVIAVYKTVTVGAILFIIISFSDAFVISSAKLIALGYWASLIILVGTGRLIIRSVQRSLLLRGIGLRPSVIVGTQEFIAEMLRKIKEFPALGYDIKGVVSTEIGRKPKKIGEKNVLGSLKDINHIIKSKNITDVLIALEFKEEDEIFKIISAVDSFDVDFSILPGPGDVLSGRMMFNQLYGFPLIRILAEPMPPWEKNVKRMIDIMVSFTILVLFSPLLLLIFFAIKIDSKGQALYIQERVGYRGRKFKLWKFRSMVADAEKHSGPVWAGKNDMRITRIGKLLRKTRLDELPQIYNIFKGDMSLVGPRPEREFFVEQLKKKIPYYPLRLKVKPGLTGWAQIKHNYDRSLDDVREKLKYDLYYIENVSLRMDFKIIIATIFVVLGQKGAH